MSEHSPGPYQRITSPKHPGAVFYKRRGTRDDFVCKFYPGHEADAEHWRASAVACAEIIPEGVQGLYDLAGVMVSLCIVEKLLAEEGTEERARWETLEAGARAVLAKAKEKP